MSDFERIGEIERSIAEGKMSTAQVFTQMRQLIPARVQQGEAESVGVAEKCPVNYAATVARFPVNRVPAGTKLYTQPPTATAGGVPEDIKQKAFECLFDDASYDWSSGDCELAVKILAKRGLLTAAPSPEQPAPKDKDKLREAANLALNFCASGEIEQRPLTAISHIRGLAMLILSQSLDQGQAAPGSGWIKCLCGAKPSSEVYEPCDDYPGNAFANWCVTTECDNCGAHPKPLGIRFQTEDEAYEAGKKHWNDFMAGLKRPQPPQAQEGE